MRENLTAELVIFLGDGEDDVRDIPMQFPTKAFIGLRGNCDFCGIFPLVQTFETDKVRFFGTHGHLYQVKSTFAALKSAAKKEKAQVALFGHTHHPLLVEENGLLLMNPGALRNGCYGILETNAGAPQGALKQLK